MRTLRTTLCGTLWLIASLASAETEQTSVFGSDGAQFDNFGDCVDIDGALMVVGAPFQDPGGVDAQGAVYVFESDGIGGWNEIKKIVAPDGVAFDQLGTDVAISGDTIAAGATGVDGPSGFSEGAAYIFRRDEGGVNNWGMVRKVVASTVVDAIADYGAAVDLQGDTLVVGARTAYSSANGGAFIYGKDVGGTDNWGIVQDLVDDVFDSNASFGVDVAVDGDVLVVGAENLDEVQGTFNNEGGIYIFTRSGGTWTQSAKLFASDSEDNARYGSAVAISGDVIVVGASGTDGPGFSAGTVYVIEKTGPGDGDWAETEVLFADVRNSSDSFGRHVSVLGDTLVVGASGVDNMGKGFRFDRSGNDWSLTTTYTASDGISGDNLGVGSAMAPGVIALGAPLTDEGGVYLYPFAAVGPTGPGSIPSVSLTVDKAAVAGNLTLSWGASCGADARDYGIYEGQLGNWYSHQSITCTDSGADLTEEIVPLIGDRYFLVVPLGDTDEGGYGTDSGGAERPVGMPACAVSRQSAVCP
ncbi:hypothetical protein ABI59_20530 [Acidobacteria bacterium Mor1]|nr:hypothetical protein ABI59_20530 [Acidobacteria bacterium Mor1]